MVMSYSSEQFEMYSVLEWCLQGGNVSSNESRTPSVGDVSDLSM